MLVKLIGYRNQEPLYVNPLSVNAVSRLSSTKEEASIIYLNAHYFFEVEGSPEEVEAKLFPQK